MAIDTERMVCVYDNLSVSSPVKGAPVAATAYVLYRAGSSYCTATQHSVSDGVLGLGKVVPLKALVEQFQNVQPSGVPDLLPDSVFVSTPGLFGWTTRGRFRPMWFNVADKRRGFSVCWPNLLWLADTNKRSLRVFAIGRSGRPSYDTRIYHAPLMNIDLRGFLCEGSAQLPERMEVTTIDAIEACLFESCFTHVNHHHTLRGGAGDRAHVAYWREKERSRKAVRVRELTRAGRLRDVLK